MASFDSIRSSDPAEVSREAFVVRGLEELERLGWEEFHVVGDTFGTATAARIAHARREAVRGLALGHACLSWDMHGERAPVKQELWAAMAELMRRDATSFVRHGLTQLTLGSYDEELAQRMTERIPSHCMQAAWAMIGERREPIGELVAELDQPLLLAKHEGCLVFTDEGFEDAAARFPDARTVAVERPPSADEGFADALRDFCREG